jgi:hypothetical protein
LRVERYGVAVDRVDHHDLEADISRSGRNLHQRVEQKLRSDATALATRVNRESGEQDGRDRICPPPDSEHRGGLIEAESVGRRGVIADDLLPFDGQECPRVIGSLLLPGLPLQSVIKVGLAAVE